MIFIMRCEVSGAGYAVKYLKGFSVYMELLITKNSNNG